VNTRDPKIHVFHCATSYDQAELAKSYSQHRKEVSIISMPCSGKLDILYLTKAFDTGADGAAIMMCKEGECRYMEGNLRAMKRVEAVDELLQEAGLGMGRVQVIYMDESGISGAIQKLEDFRVHIESMVRVAPEVQTSHDE
jgi:coenzyme F420-reducing hydrogenase delta subunit